MPTDTKIELDLNPNKVLDGMQEMSKAGKLLNEDLQKSLKSVELDFDKLDKSAQNVADKVSSSFRNLGTRLKEDMKNFIDVGKVISGLSMAGDIKKGIGQVFEMEQSFARLNTRLGLSGKELTQFKNNVGRAAATAGIDMEKIMPGVENFSAKGGVKSSGQLGDIAKVMAQTQAVTGESSEGLSDSIIGILRDQGREITAQSVKETANALASTRISGAFSSSQEAGDAIQKMTSNLKPEQLKAMGLGTRELGGMAAMASRGGDRGMDIMQSIMQQAAEPGGQSKINAALGAKIFGSNGKMDVGAFSNVSPNAWGQYTSQGRAAALGVNQADLSRFITSMQKNQGQFGAVTGGANEVENQFKSIDTMSQKWNVFKGRAVEGTREIGSGISDSVKSMLGGDFHGAMGGLSDAGVGLKDNAAPVSGAVGLTGMSAWLTGSGLKGLLGAKAVADVGAGTATAGSAATAAGMGMSMAGAAPMAGAMGIAGAAVIPGYMAANALNKQFGAGTKGEKDAEEFATKTANALEKVFAKYLAPLANIGKSPQINKSDVRGTGGQR